MHSNGRPLTRTDPSRLVLGTAQFGDAYGIANRRGRLSLSQVSAILRAARSAGVTTVDTAAAYGDCEARLGDIGTDGLRMISKLAPGTQPGDVGAAVTKSLTNLRRERLDGLLVHRSDSSAQTVDLLWAMRADPRVSRVGVSVYHPCEVEALIDLQAPLDIVQAPFSVLDQRFAESFSALRVGGAEVHARSVFVQGLCFLDDEQMTGTLASARSPVRRVRDAAADLGIPLAALMLGYVLEQPWIDRVVVGVDRVEHLRAHIRTLEHPPISAFSRWALAELAIDDEDILLPARWRP